MDNMSKIEKGKPLPNHTKLDYDECYAKLVLERYFADRYSSLRISDKPDLIDDENDIGVEVTSADSKKRREAISLFCKMPYYSLNKQESAKERMRQLGEPYQGMVQSWSTNHAYKLDERHPLMNFIKIVEKKVSTLNKKHYQKLKQYDLYVYSEFLWRDHILPEITEKINEVNNEDLKFSFVYLFLQDSIYEYNLNGSCRIVELNNIKELPRQARAMVVEAENENT